MKDRRDTCTLDLLEPHFVASSVVSAISLGLVALLEAAHRDLDIVQKRWRAAQPAFSGFAIARTGPLADEEKDLIEELAELGLKPWSIARRLRRHPSTVTWFMSTVGLKRLGRVRKEPFMRAGREVRPFSDAEDAFAQKCSCAGELPAAIARKLTQRFGYERSRDTVACRLMWLASDEAAREAAMEAAA